MQSIAITQIGDEPPLSFAVRSFYPAPAWLDFVRFASGGALPGQLVEMGFYTSCPTSSGIPQMGDAQFLASAAAFLYIANVI